MRGCITRDLQKMAIIPHQSISRPARSPEGKSKAQLEAQVYGYQLFLFFKARTLEIIFLQKLVEV